MWQLKNFVLLFFIIFSFFVSQISFTYAIANICPGEPRTLNWSSSNVSGSCTPSWSTLSCQFSVVPNSSQSTTITTSVSCNVSLTCDGVTANDSISINPNQSRCCGNWDLVGSPTWNGSSCVAAQTPTATISGTPCTVAIGASSCSANFNWSSGGGATNVTASSCGYTGQNYTGSCSATVFTAQSGTSGSVTGSLTPNGAYAVVRVNGVDKQSIQIASTCASGSTWNGSTCAANAPQTIPSPSNVQAVCSQNGTYATISWTDNYGSNRFYTRISKDGVQQTSSPIWSDDFGGTTGGITVTPGSAYYFWVHSKNISTGAYSDPAYLSFSCAAPSAPTITQSRTPNPGTVGQSFSNVWSTTNATRVYATCTGAIPWSGYLPTSYTQTGQYVSSDVGTTYCDWIAENETTGQQSAVHHETLVVQSGSCGNGATNPPSCTTCPSGQVMTGGNCATPSTPTLSANFSPYNVTVGSASTLSWSTTNAIGIDIWCDSGPSTARSAWEQFGITSGSSKTVTSTSGMVGTTGCHAWSYNNYGQHSARFDFNWGVSNPAPSAPTITQSRTPNPGTVGQSFSNVWSTTNATRVYATCTGAIPWSGYLPTSYTQTGQYVSSDVGTTYCDWIAENETTGQQSAVHHETLVVQSGSCGNGATNPPSCTTCPSGQVMYNGSCTTTTASINAPGCTIAIGASTCTSTFTWSSSNINSPVFGGCGYTSPSYGGSCNVTIFANQSGASGSVVATLTGNGAYVRITDNTYSPTYSQTQVPVSCASGSTWNGSSCAADTCLNGGTNPPSCNACPSGQEFRASSCQVIPPPTNPIASCSQDGTSATFSWTAPTGHPLFYTRASTGGVNLGAPAWDDNFSGTSKTFNTTPGNTYTWWVHTKDPSSGNWSTDTGGTFTCDLPPTVSSAVVNINDCVDPSISLACSNSDSYQVQNTDTGVMIAQSNGTTATVPINDEGNYSIVCKRSGISSTPAVRSYSSVSCTPRDLNSIISPRTIRSGTSATISWGITYPNSSCSLSAKAICPNGATSCPGVREDAANAINNILMSGYTDSNDPNGSRPIQSTVKTKISGTKSNSGKKTLIVNYTTEFILKCTSVQDVKSRVQVSSENEG